MSEERTERDDCYICSRGNPDILEGHHIVPSRFGGSDYDPNIVELCPTCHSALERLYDARFWTKVGALSRERQMDIIIDDITDWLEQVELDITMALSHHRRTLDKEYRNVGYAEMQKQALDRLSHERSDDADSADGSGEGGEQPDFSETSVLVEHLEDKVRYLQEEYHDRPGAPIKMLHSEFLEKGVVEEETDYAITTLRDRGEIYHPDQNHVRLV